MIVIAVSVCNSFCTHYILAYAYQILHLTKKYYHLLDTKTTKVTVDTLRQNTNFVNWTMSKKKSTISGGKIEPKNSTSKICLVKIKMVQKS